MAIQEAHPEAMILGVALDGIEPQFYEFIDSSGADGVQHISSDSSRQAANALAEEHRVLTFPTFVILRTNGEVEVMHQSTAEQLDARLDELAAA